MSQLTICLIIFVLMIVGFFIKKLPMSFTAMAATAAFILTGCLDANDAFACFSTKTVITIVSMFIVAAGLSRTQMITKLSDKLLKVTKGSYTKTLATYVVVTLILAQFIPSFVAVFSIVLPLVASTCEEMKISPSKMVYPVAMACVSCSYIIEPIGPYAAWYVTLNGYMESYGWTETQFGILSETSVLLPVGIITALVAIFIVPRFLPDEPETPITMVSQKTLAKQEPLSPVREFLGYAVFVVVIICLIAGLPSWAVAMIGACVVVLSGVLTEREAIGAMNMNMLLLYVGVTVAGTALDATGAAQLLGDGIAYLLKGVTNGYIIGFAFFVVSFLMTSLLYNRAVTTVLVPLTVITCSAIGADPRGCIILCSLGSMSSLITPMATAAVPMAMSAGGYSQKTILKAGLLPALIRGVIGTLIAMTLFPV